MRNEEPAVYCRLGSNFVNEQNEDEETNWIKKL